MFNLSIFLLFFCRTCHLYNIHVYLYFHSLRYFPSSDILAYLFATFLKLGYLLNYWSKNPLEILLMNFSGAKYEEGSINVFVP